VRPCHGPIAERVSITMRLLIVEDDPELATVLTRGFGEHEIETSHAATIEDARTLALTASFDVLLLDVMLPGGSGFDLCRDLRRAGHATPILMLTARDTVDDRVHGLDAGADDYLTKPFAFRELLARVRALARRRPALVPRVVEVADLVVDLASHRVSRAGRAMELTAKEFALLECLALHAGQVVDRTTITAHVWDDNHDPFTNVLEVLVRRLRRKLDDDFATKLIQTVRGAGYLLGA
jgi:two-component system copper resistance phosphate regulon response regulator CusR